MDERRFAIALSMLAELHDKKLSPALSKMYFDILKDELTTEQFERAVFMICKTRKYSAFPKPAEILECIKGDPQDTALLAWSVVLRSVEKFGFYESVDFQDKIIHDVIDSMGGWMNFSSIEKKDIGFIQKRFIDLYNALKLRSGEDKPRLIGYYECQNSNAGYKTETKKIKCSYVGMDKQKKIEDKNDNKRTNNSKT